MPKSSDTSQLEIGLKKFSSELLSWIQEGKAKKRIVLESNQFTQRKLVRMDYGSIIGLLQYKYVPINKQYWSFDTIQDYVDEYLKDNSTYEQLVDGFSKISDMDIARAKSRLDSFIQEIVKQSVEQNYIVTDQLIKSFTKVFDKSPRNWQICLWLDNIWLIQDELVVDDSIVIRRPNDTDFETIIELEPDFNDGWLQCPAIMEVNFVSTDESEVYRYISRIVDTLRLYKVGSIRIMKQKMESDVFQMHNTQITHLVYSLPYRYPLDEKDIGPLKEMILNLTPKLPIDSRMASPNSRIGLLDIAIERYRDSIIQPTIMESRITSAITCLESLYLTENDELTFRLALRSSILLQMVGVDGLSVFNNVKVAYKIRSEYVHGTPIKQSKLNEAMSLSQTILDYSRLSIIVFLYLGISDLQKKKELIKKIDEALIDEKKRADLSDLVNKTLDVNQLVKSSTQK